jgi:hypothetical protein
MGLPANTTFDVKIGRGGIGATSEARSTNGGNSSLSGTFLNYNGTPVTHHVVAQGGGGGGSNIVSHTHGLPGGSGGGGAMHLAAGTGGAPSTLGLAYRGANGRSGSVLGALTYQGGGGGGAGSAGTAGTSSEMLGSRGGDGGIGARNGISTRTELYAAGGGGTSSALIDLHSTRGVGGSGIGGDANNSGQGGSGKTNTGSGGGAGSTMGGNGGSGSLFIYYSIYSILPVEFSSFIATYHKSTRSGLLSWTTTKEWENDRFEIERSINNVRDWQTIGQVKGAGYSDQSLDYLYSDSQLPLTGGNIFYRLNQRDYHGDTSYSDTKSIQVEAMPGTSYWRVYPNPTTGPISLELLNRSISTDESISIRIISTTGQTELIQSKGYSSMGAEISKRLLTKPVGIYTLEISWGIYREYHKVLLTH